MEVMEAIETRKSIRSYEDKPVPVEKLNKVLEAARLSPSASNRQPRRFVVVRDSGIRARLAEATGGQTSITEAPVVIVAVATMPDYIMRCEVPSYPVDMAIAIDHMTLAAVDEGLGTCWIGSFSQQKAKEAVGIPGKYKIVALLSLGFPRTLGNPKARKTFEELVCYETFKE